jgi:hypothetical protein
MKTGQMKNLEVRIDAMMCDEIKSLTKQRDELLKLVKYLASIKDGDILGTPYIRRIAEEALSKVGEL